MKKEDALAFMHRTSRMRSRLGLERMRDMMRRLGNPQDELQFIHVAGTNGKGSVCAMLSSILTTSGYRTGLYTSPHLTRVNERFKMNGTDISDDDLIAIAQRVEPVVARMGEQPTEFEIITAMAFLYFREQKCDIVVLEVGLGGRLDATNIIACPLVSVITNIGLEHTEVLGDTLEKIAAEKVGIVKRDGTVVVYPQLPSVESVIEQVCKDRQAERIKIDMDDVVFREEALEGQTFDWKRFAALRLRMLGRHQIWNAVVALSVVEHLHTRGWSIHETDVRK